MAAKTEPKTPNGHVPAGASIAPSMAAIVALAGFAVSVCAGIAGGVEPSAVLVRSIGAMLVCYPVGFVIGVASQRVIVDHITLRGASATNDGSAETTVANDEGARG